MARETKWKSTESTKTKWKPKISRIAGIKDTTITDHSYKIIYQIKLIISLINGTNWHD